MKLVLDSNILFSIMKLDSVASFLFSSLGAEFFVPEYIKDELRNHKSECLLKSKLSEHEFHIRQADIEGSIKFCKFSEYGRFLKDAVNALPDPKDSPYLALALAIKSEVWSNDPHLKQQALVKVSTTKDLIDKLLADKI